MWSESFLAFHWKRDSRFCPKRVSFRCSHLVMALMLMKVVSDTLPTGAILAVLILVFGPLSGAHFNPAVPFLQRADEVIE